MRSEAYTKDEQEAFMKQRMILRYRLYGRDGVSQAEYGKLKDWGVIKKLDDETQYIKVKKRVQKQRKNSETGRMEYYSSERSESNSSCYSYKRVEVETFEENDVGDPFEKNEGFAIEPLCPEIFGSKKALESRIKQQLKKRERIKKQRQLRAEQNAYSTNKATFINPRGSDFELFGEQSGTTLQPGKMPNLRLPPSITQSKPLTHINSPDGRSTPIHFSQTLHPSDSIDMSFMKGIKPPQQAKNEPVLKKKLLMPHLVNKPREFFQGTSLSFTKTNLQNKFSHMLIDNNS